VYHYGYSDANRWDSQCSLTRDNMCICLGTGMFKLLHDHRVKQGRTPQKREAIRESVVGEVKLRI